MQDSTQEYVQILRHDVCAYCGNKGGFVDHVDLYTDHWSNYTSARRRCNTAKCQHTLLRYLLAKRIRSERDRLNTELQALGSRYYLQTTASSTNTPTQTPT